MKTLLLAFLLIVIFCQRLAARPQFGSGADLVEGAKREKKLVFYTSMELPQNITVVHSFIEKYPFMDLELHPLDSRTLVKRVQDEARAGISNWDILLGGGGSFQPLFEANMVASYNSPERAAVSELFNDDKGYWSGYYINPYVLGYNTTSIKKEEVPKKYVDLLEPRWKARRIAIDAEAHALLRGLVAAWGEAKAVRYLKRLEQQQPLVAPASIIAVDAVHVGKVSAAIARAPVIQGYKQKLASPIEWVFLAPVVAQIDAAMLSAYARNPFAARLFIDFILSKEGQIALADVQQIPIRRDMESPANSLLEGHSWFVERPDKGTNTRTTIKLFREIFNLQ